MELGFLEDDVGGLLLRETTSDYVSWDGGVAGGAEPIWLMPPARSQQDLALCTRCQQPMTFLIQVYAPLDEVGAAFHRDLCVFFCSRCPVDPICSAICLRMQVSEMNKFYPDSEIEDVSKWPVPNRSKWSIFSGQKPFSFRRRYAVVLESLGDNADLNNGVEADDDDEEEEEDGSPKEREGPCPCFICGTETKTRCSACRSYFYCRKEHQVEHWKNGHKQECKDIQDLRTTQKDLDKAAAMGDKVTQKKLEEGKDKFFRKFLSVTKSQPSQVLRYQRWPEISPEVWVSQEDQPTSKPPACQHCGGERNFEMQITPQFLSYFSEDLLQLEASRGSDFDFGTICIYTCTNSCGTTSGELLKEFAYCQPASRESERF